MDHSLILTVSFLSDIGGEEEEPFSPFEEDRDVQEEEEGEGEELFGDNFEA